VELRDSESLIFRCRANRSVGRRALGGHLYLTNQRLVFEPRLIDRLLSREGLLEVPLTRVAAADVAPRGAGLFDGSRRRRLRVREIDESEELFVVSRPDDLAAEITQAARPQ
jgi:hypothetical protein